MLIVLIVFTLLIVATSDRVLDRLTILISLEVFIYLVRMAKV